MNDIINLAWKNRPNKVICECNSCQESVNGGCDICKYHFEDGDKIYCKHRRHCNCEHFCEDCAGENTECTTKTEEANNGN